MTKKELFNARNTGRQIEAGLKISLVDVDTFSDTDKNGNSIDVAALKDQDGTIYTTISATVIRAVDDLKELLEESDEVIECEVKEGVSNNGRAFFQIVVK